MNPITKISVLLVLASLCLGAMAQSYSLINDISYTSKADAYSLERLKLDVYHPESIDGCPVVIWFHGGGLEGGNKEIPSQLREKGIVVVGVNYRLLPLVTVRETLDDDLQRAVAGNDISSVMKSMRTDRSDHEDIKLRFYDRAACGKAVSGGSGRRRKDNTITGKTLDVVMVDQKIESHDMHI